MRLAAFTLVVLAASTAFADRVTAEKLFQEGRALMDQGKIAEACAKLEASDKEDPAMGTELNLASCWEKLGKTASAWSLYMQLASSARADRAQFARERAAQLQPTLSKLTVNVTSPNAYVTVDGVTLRVAEYGVAVPVDPGRHVVEAKSGDKRFRREVTVAPNAASVTVVVSL